MLTRSARSRSSEPVDRRRARRPAAASRIAFAIAVRDEFPCAITASPRRPRRYAPPYVSGSRRSRRWRAAGRISKPPSLPRVEERISSRSPSSTRLDRALEQLEADVAGEAVADDDVAGMASSRWRLSTLPPKLRSVRGEERVRLERELVPLLGLLADREQPHLGLRDLEHLLGEDRAHLGELEQVLGPRVRVRAASRGAPTARPAPG